MRRNISALCLALVLAVGSAAMAVARDAARSGSEVVICTGYGVVTVTLDDRGAPVGAGHPCPDCIVMAAGLPPRTPEVPRPVARARRGLRHARATVRGRRPAEIRVRDPPLRR
ncbi:MAG: hypothetical protein ACK4KW_12880 [Gemmobacter sp.]